MLGMIGAIACHLSGEKVRFFRILLIILQEEKGAWERGCSARQDNMTSIVSKLPVFIRLYNYGQGI